MIPPSAVSPNGPIPSPRPAVPHPDLRRKAHARLLERIDPARARHKPLSLIRQDARRLLETYLDQEITLGSKADRDRLIEDVLASALAVGVLEEHFRDETVKEVMVVSATTVLYRKGGAWHPSSVRYRDADQVRAVLAWYAEIGEPVVAGPMTGGLDVRLPFGFRLVAVLPPAILDHPPPFLLVRLDPAEFVATPATALTRSGRIPVTSRVLPTPTPPSAAVPAPSPRATQAIPVPARDVPKPSRVKPRTDFAEPDPAPPDPFARLRQRVGELIVMKFAGAGIYDLNQIPVPELRRIVVAAVIDMSESEKLTMDDLTRERVALEILAGMNR